MVGIAVESPTRLAIREVIIIAVARPLPFPVGRGVWEDGRRCHAGVAGLRLRLLMPRRLLKQLKTCAVRGTSSLGLLLPH